MRVAVLAVFLALAGCATVPMLPDDIPFEVNLAAQGLAVSGAEKLVEFGRTEASSIASVTKLMLGPPKERVVQTECGAGRLTVVTWDPGLTLYFQDGVFRGWLSRSALLITDTGFSTGMTRAQMRAAGVSLQPTSLGDEFQRGGISGLIEDEGQNAPVTALWAGVGCFFR